MHKKERESFLITLSGFIFIINLIFSCYRCILNATKQIFQVHDFYILNVYTLRVYFLTKFNAGSFIKSSFHSIHKFVITKHITPVSKW